ncbi:uncharacterized protein NP_7022A (plasmid) [Natronomonas pharaonis DSM 2160]|uniref:Uncharacterized protein n=1 Tax=Natronomonas pharaonis (strain ATCC 35678 / DSM 2160 / CIP 103997 / JCM 8858 / NBRC 14720 / NCIMB 2260 / Gabara) TaxID=348780 RepID=Q3ILU3_NATPD|nr:hypothetical protein [Natronomonas pharaonis]CAI49740.1 uncharacterized protein NP_3298A [Natronomonas pharaonis DSM 2160]CAI50927.1 uncharacterized protein NP_7022A [Natronomonas pharaonis DSM 2160]
MDSETQEHMDAQEDRQLTASSQQAVMSAAAEKQHRKLENSHFLNELRDSDLGDSELFEWLEDEHPTWFSGAHAVSNRGDTWDDEADLLMFNKRERALAENRPGRLLRGRPFLLATAQGAETPQLDAYDQPGIPGDRQYWKRKTADKESARRPMSSEEQSRLYGAAEVAADLMALSKNAAGLDATTTATTETRVRREEQEEGAASRLGRFYE